MSEPERGAGPGGGAGAELPRWAPSPREYDDLALALDGILTEVTVAVPSGLAPGGDAIAAEIATAELTDPEGTPVARLDVSTAAETTPGAWTLTGTVTALRPREDGVFRHLHRSPAQVRDALGQDTGIAAVVLDAPLDQAALDRLAGAVAGYDAAVLLALVGAGSPRGVSAHSLVRATLAAADLLPGQPLVVPVPLAARTDPAADLALRELVAGAYGDPVRLAVEPSSRSAAEGGGDYPAPIAAALAPASRGVHERGLVVFFTGLSGSGKSTLARRLHDLVLERGDRTVTSLDGDVVRRMLSAGLGFSRADREANIARIGFVAAEVARHGGLAICAPIAPYTATRAEVRRMVEAAGGTFVLIHVSTPLAECERRDRKGLYARARAGLIPEFTGISDPYEPPDDADLVIDTTDVTIDDAAAKVLGLLDERGLLSSPPPTP